MVNFLKFKIKITNFHFIEFVQPVCLPIPNLHPLRAGEKVYITGFGRTLQSRASQIKQKLLIPIFNQQDCVKKFATKNVEIHDDQICAGGGNSLFFIKFIANIFCLF